MLKRRIRDFFESYLAILPALSFMFILVVAVILGLVMYSFFTWTKGVTTPAFTMKNYVQFLTDPYYLYSLYLTLKIALSVTVIDLILGYPIAYTMARTRNSSFRAIMWFIVLTPMLVSSLVTSYGWLVIFGRYGLINTLLMNLGFIQEPLRLLYTTNTLIIGMAYEDLPFMVLPLVSVIQKIDRSLEEAAKTLKAGKLRTFLHITLPLSMPGILAGILLVFSIAVSSFVAPLVLGGGKIWMLSLWIEEHMMVILNWPFGSAISVFLACVTLILSNVYRKVLGSRTLGGGR